MQLILKCNARTVDLRTMDESTEQSRTSGRLSALLPYKKPIVFGLSVNTSSISWCHRLELSILTSYH